MSHGRRIAGFVLLSVIWGSSWMAFSELEGHCPPFRVAAIRYGVAAAVLLGVAALRAASRGTGRRESRPRGRALRAMVVLGVTMVALPFALLFWGGRGVSASAGAVIFALSPIALVLVSSAGGGAETPRTVFYAVLGGFGALVLAMSGSLAFPAGHIAALLAVVAAVGSVTASVVFAKRELSGCSPLFSAGIQLAVAALSLAVVSGVLERGRPSEWTAESLFSLGLLSILGSAVALPLFYWLLQGWEPAHVGTVEWMQPLIAAGEGAALLHQPVPLTFWLGSLGVVACTAFVLGSTKEQEP